MNKPLSTDKLAEAVKRLRAMGYNHMRFTFDADLALVCDAAESAPRVPDAQQVSADELIEECAKISDDELNLDQHSEGHPEFFAKYGTVEVSDAIRAKKGTRSLAPETEKDKHNG